MPINRYYLQQFKLAIQQNKVLFSLPREQTQPLPTDSTHLDVWEYPGDIGQFRGTLFEHQIGSIEVNCLNTAHGQLGNISGKLHQEFKLEGSQ